ncbi:hypothetical protein K491DRAFT_674859 [Lophiostoma macrostomum CBS 122681]|uniref:Uncharacterized protein n=1 Tax=Lophiostoma macrostomum CBS 122681 TaxID=1314788 RepID=A0A6A6TK06_9PLEO|nr:hypothetical protein K491DRAFT_674859 [Lophiostoma macrostomum CBS 122681]
MYATEHQQMPESLYPQQRQVVFSAQQSGRFLPLPSKTCAGNDHDDNADELPTPLLHLRQNHFFETSLAQKFQAGSSGGSTIPWVGITQRWPGNISASYQASVVHGDVSQYEKAACYHLEVLSLSTRSENPAGFVHSFAARSTPSRYMPQLSIAYSNQLPSYQRHESRNAVAFTTAVSNAIRRCAEHGKQVTMVSIATDGFACNTELLRPWVHEMPHFLWVIVVRKLMQSKQEYYQRING